MKTMLVPVDFTDTSKNAVRYAAEWAKAYGYERIILLKTLTSSIYNKPLPSTEYVSVNQESLDQERDEARQGLNDICNGLRERIGPGIKVSVAVSELTLVRSILEIIDNEHPQLIVLGSDNINHNSGSYVAGSIISIAKISPVRVLIVPSHYTHKPVEKALVPVDFDRVETLDKIQKHTASSPNFRPKLLVLNVDPKERYLNRDDNFTRRENILHGYLQNFTHELAYSNHGNIIDGLVAFAETNDIELIIALPGKHSFLYSLTHSSISEAIYANAKHPVLILK